MFFSDTFSVLTGYITVTVKSQSYNGLTNFSSAHVATSFNPVVFDKAQHLIRILYSSPGGSKARELQGV